MKLAVLDPALGRSGAHNRGFAEAFAHRYGASVGFWCADAIPAEARDGLAAGGATVRPLFRQDFYALYHRPGWVAEHWPWIHALATDFLAALRDVLATWPGERVRVLHHTLSWEHATALSLAIRLLGAEGRALSHLALLMYSPGVDASGATIDVDRRRKWKLAFSALAEQPGVALHAGCGEYAQAYAALLGLPAPLPVHPCLLGDWSETDHAARREPARVIVYLGEAKQEKGFLELPQRLADIAGGSRDPGARFVVHCVECRTDAARAVMARVREIAASDPRIEVHEGYWDDARLREQLERASAMRLDYDPAVYAHKTSGLLWLAAWHRMRVHAPKGTWLWREGLRLGVPLDGAGRGTRDEAYWRVVFRPFHEWLEAQPDRGSPAPPAVAAPVDPDLLADVHAAMQAAADAAAATPRPSPPGGGGADVILFWKQNDSTLYGRRSDMVARYLASRADVRRVIVVDAPISDARLASLPREDALHQGAWIRARTLAKLRGEQDAPRLFHRVFAYPASRFGEFAHESGDPVFAAAYGDWLERLFAREGVVPADAAFWTYPRDFNMPALLERFRPGRLVVDLVDDDRAWPGVSPRQQERLAGNVSALAGAADLVLANCEPVQRAWADVRGDIALVPNGCDPGPGPSRAGTAPPATGAVIGYVGNLEAKVDIGLLEAVARRFPQHRLVLVGSTHANPATRALAALPNVEMPGVVPYDRLGDWLSRFDVGIIPHLDMAMTRRMNPLKAYVYLGRGIPVVSTAVANVAADGELVHMAASHAGFLHLLDQVLARPRPPRERFEAYCDANGWQARLEGVVDGLRLQELRRAG